MNGVILKNNKVIRNVYRIAVSFMLILLLACPAFAESDVDSDSSLFVPDATEQTTNGDTINIFNQIQSDSVVSENTSMSILRVSASDVSGLHSIILRLIGDYTPVVKDYTYTSTNGYTSHSIAIQEDWSWIASAFIFCIVLYSFFRIIGSLFGGK